MSSSSPLEPLLYSREPAGAVDKDRHPYEGHAYHPQNDHHHRAHPPHREHEKEIELPTQEILLSTTSIQDTNENDNSNTATSSEHQAALMHRNGYAASQYPPRPTYPPQPTYPPRPSNQPNRPQNTRQLPPDLRDPAASHHFAGSDSDDDDAGGEGVGLSIRKRKADWRVGAGYGHGHGQGQPARQAKRMPILPLLPLAPSPPHTAVPHPQTAIHVPPTARAMASNAGGGSSSHLALSYTASSSSSNGSSPTSPLPASPTSSSASDSTSNSNSNAPTLDPLLWSHPLEHADRARERAFDAEQQAGAAQVPGHGAFEVDRKVLKDVVREKMGEEVGRIRFLSGGTFHKAYLVTLSSHQTLVARVARRFMPRLKTASEVATIAYLGRRTPVPVPTIYDYDANPYNRLGGEWVLMSKAPGIPLAEVWHGLSYADIVKLLKDLAARVIIPLFAHRFEAIGSLYFGPDPAKPPTSSSTNGNASANTSASGMSRVNSSSSGMPTPRATAGLGDPFAVALGMGMTGLSGESNVAMSSFAQAGSALTPTPSSVCVPELAHIQQQPEDQYNIGPIISWPFFGSNRGELAHPTEINRGPFPSLHTYLAACLAREHTSVIRENEGKAAPHRLHLDPDEVHSSFHHRLLAVPGDESDDSDEWGLEESDDEWEGPGDKMYRDYRRMQRGTFLVRELKEREERVRAEMGRWVGLMQGLTAVVGSAGAGGEGAQEEFGLDCHDLSLENVFVDEQDHTKITCIIDWESTTTRPLWQCAHVPSFMQSSPFVTKLFREVVARLPTDPSVSIQLPSSYSSSSHSSSPTSPSHKDLASLCREWLYYEAAGTRLRMAHRCAEWDGWEEGLVDSILGAEEDEAEWYSGLDRLVEDYRAGCSGVEVNGKKGLQEAERPCAEHSPLHDLFESGPGSPLHSGYNPERRINARALSSPSPSTLSPGPSPRRPSSSVPLPSSVSKPNGTSNANLDGKAALANTSRATLPPPVASTLPQPPSSARLPNTSSLAPAPAPVPKLSSKLPLRVEQEKEQMLNTTGDICGGRGGELGRRLEAWLEVSGSKDRVDA